MANTRIFILILLVSSDVFCERTKGENDFPKNLPFVADDCLETKFVSENTGKIVQNDMENVDKEIVGNVNVSYVQVFGNFNKKDEKSMRNNPFLINQQDEDEFKHSFLKKEKDFSVDLIENHNNSLLFKDDTENDNKTRQISQDLNENDHNDKIETPYNNLVKEKNLSAELFISNSTQNETVAFLNKKSSSKDEVIKFTGSFPKENGDDFPKDYNGSSLNPNSDVVYNFLIKEEEFKNETVGFLKRKPSTKDDVKKVHISEVEEDDFFNPTPDYEEYGEGTSTTPSAVIKPVIIPSSPNNRSVRWWKTQGKERERDTVIRFSGSLPKEKYLTGALHLDRGLHPFSFLSAFFYLLHPFDFPAELLRDVLWKRVSMAQVVFQSIHLEAGFIVFIIIALILALVVPSYCVCRVLLAMMSTKKDEHHGSPTPGLMMDDEDGAGSCKRRCLMFVMQALMAFMAIAVIGMIIGNEYASSGAGQTRTAFSAAFRDLPTFIRETHMSISHTLLHSADQAFNALEHDLDRVDVLLGEPIQKALAVETGIDVALDALDDISTACDDMSNKVTNLANLGMRAVNLSNAARDRLRDLKRQLDSVRRYCNSKDRPLCETIDSTGVELIIGFEIVNERSLEHLIEVLSARNLSLAAVQARDHFIAIPKAVQNETASIIEDVRHGILLKRNDLQIAERSLSRVSRHLSSITGSSSRHVENILWNIDAFDLWRWIIFWTAIGIISLVMLKILIGMCCGCCGAEGYACFLLNSSVIMMFLFVLPLWALAIFTFVVGGHGEVFLCRPLYDEPEYKAITKLLDRPGLLYEDGGGFFNDLFKDLDNITIEVPVKEVIRDCRMNKPAYKVFRLDRVLDLNAQTAYFNWSVVSEIGPKLGRRPLVQSSMLPAPMANVVLQNIMRATSLNFTDYRMQFNGPLTGKDLSSLADQLESIANQISDLTTSSRIETLASRTRRLIASTMHPLEQLRIEIIYKLTEIELQMQPFQRQMNQSLSHLKTIQFYIDNQGSVIAEKKSTDYAKRLTGYLEQYRSHVIHEVENNVAPCGPLFDIYEAARSLLCRYYVDSLNGFWFSLYICLTIWIAAVPAALNLRRACKEAKDRRSEFLLRTISHQNSSENTAICEQSAWSTPGQQQQDNWR